MGYQLSEEAMAIRHEKDQILQADSNGWIWKVEIVSGDEILKHRSGARAVHSKITGPASLDHWTIYDSSNKNVGHIYNATSTFVMRCLENRIIREEKLSWSPEQGFTTTYEEQPFRR